MTARATVRTAEAANEATSRAADAANEATSRAADTAKEATSRTADAAKEATSRTAGAANKATADTVSVLKDATDRYGSLVADTQRSVSETFEKVSKGIESLSTFSQENVEAVVKSSERAAKAFEGIGSEISAYSKRSFEDSVAAAQDFASAKTVTELLEKQTAYAQSAFEGWLQQATKLNEIAVAAAKDISAPINSRIGAASNAVRSLAA